MIVITRKKFCISITESFFAVSPHTHPALSTIGFVVQAQTQFPGSTPFRTLIVDLEQAAGTIFAGLSRGTREKIKRAEKESLTTKISVSPERAEITAFADYYDTFSRQKGLSASNRRKLFALREAGALILSTVADEKGRPLAAHAYVSDGTARRARLLYSASHFRAMTESAERNLVGRANRLLHWFDMMSLKNLQFREYDFGGFARDHADPALQAIAEFKAGFGGRQVVEFSGFVPGTRFGRFLLSLMKLKKGGRQ